MTLLQQGKADLVIGQAAKPPRHHLSVPLFRFEVLIMLPLEHRLNRKRRLCAKDLENETLITYPVAEERINLIREILTPDGIEIKRRTAELTITILQLVASRRWHSSVTELGCQKPC